MAAGTAVTPRGRWWRAWDVIDERLGLSGLAYPVPAHANGIGYILGGISFFGFLILAATGVWLAQFYSPSPGAARESIAYIMDTAPLGDIVRGIHFWVANLVMATVLLHMGRVFLTGAYKRPREANWLIGVGSWASPSDSSSPGPSSSGTRRVTRRFSTMSRSASCWAGSGSGSPPNSPPRCRSSVASTWPTS